MKVETFETEVEQHPEACEESKRLIEQLGLEGQMPTADGERRCPYRQWNQVEHDVYTALLPNCDKVEKYAADSMPLRVLQMLAHATELGVFEGFEVRHAAAMKDPILLAFMPGDRYQQTRYLLARWGDELEEFPALLAKAARMRTAQARTAAARIIERAKVFLACLDDKNPDVLVQIPQAYYLGELP